MGFYEIANHPLIYTMVIIGILTVCSFAIISMRKSWNRAKQLGYSKEKLMNVVKSSITFTIVPSIAIVVGVFSIAAMLGIPWPWWRLSVVGSVTYEIMATEMALGTAGVELATATGADFILIMFVMTIGIMGGIITCPIVSKRIQSGTMKMKDKDPRWGSLGNSVFMMIIILVFLIPMVLEGGVQLLTLITSALIAVILSLIVKKFHIAWLDNFILAFSLLGAMASSVLWTALLG